MSVARFMTPPPAVEVTAIVDHEHPSDSPPIERLRRPRPHPVFWIIAVALAIIAVEQVLRWDSSSLEGRVLAQPVASGGARGVFAFSGQLSKNTYGVYMVDVDAMTISVYEFNQQKNCLRLAAARTWRYDRYLENYNICDLPPDTVERMIEDQRRYRLESSESQMP